MKDSSAVKPMTHADAFLRDILAHPDDDAPRLIFADWLEEQGDAGSVARAEFIRIQCSLAGDNPPDQQRAQLHRCQQQILEEWGKVWVRPIRRLVQTWEFHRGFIDEVSMSPEVFLARADQLFRRAPIQHLDLWAGYGEASFSSRQPVNVAALADNEYLRRLRSLDLSANLLESRDVRALVVSQHLTNLLALDLSNNRIGDGGVRALASSSVLGRLWTLNLRNNDIGANGLRVLMQALEGLAGSPEGLRLRRLELSPANLSAAVQRLIADSPLLQRLVRS